MKKRLAHLALAAALGQRASGSHAFESRSRLARDPRSRLLVDIDPGDGVNGTKIEIGYDTVRPGHKAIAKSRFTADNFIGEVDVLDAKTPSSGVRHPFWHFEAHYLQQFQVYICCIVLFLAGVLCSAGGIGGGGIYVTVLMVAGCMKVADAVPLSKSVVFFGSISSLILNMRKQSGGGAKQLIDYNICRLVVPASLLGTFLGVFFNRHLPSWLILLVLVCVLVFITFSATSKTWSQYQEETAAANAVAAQAGGGAGGADEESASGPGRPAAAPAKEPEKKADEAETSMRSTLSVMDMVISLSMLIIVIVFGMLRFHAGECMRATPELKEEACNHPAYFWLGHGTLERWMSSNAGATVVRGFSFLFPLFVCLTVLLLYTWMLVSREGWRLTETSRYSVMAICTGCLAGLVGIGGGLIFSPFFLIMGVDPSIAVASSSTCVIFTSSSTTMQYLLTDRIIISLTVVYGVINLVASYVGTSLVHMLQDKFSARKSYISLIVLLGVVISTVLSIIKLVAKFKEHFGPVGHTHPLGAH